MKWNNKTKVILLVTVPESYLAYRVPHKSERFPLLACKELGLKVERVCRVTHDGLWRFYTPAIEQVVRWCEADLATEYLVLISDFEKVKSETNQSSWKSLHNIARVYPVDELFYEVSIFKQVVLIPELYFEDAKGEEDEETSPT